MNGQVNESCDLNNAFTLGCNTCLASTQLDMAQCKIE